MDDFKDANPYRSPEAFGPGDMDALEARRKVIGPAVGMIACSIVGLLYCCGWVVWALVVDGGGLQAESPTQSIYVLTLAVSGLAMIVYGAMLYGSVQMLQRKSRGWAMAASVLALVPCNVFTVLSIGFGIWGIVVLRNAHVKAVFR